ncbi:MAG: hypothetical protein Q7S14_00230 [bacterium]|nr:hypothetical protein [bacterium]
MHRLTIEQIQKIKGLRENGFSLPEISNELKIPKTTVFHHARKFQVKPEFLELWKRKQGGSFQRMLIKQEAAYKEGQDFAKKLTDREKLILLAALYWGEGSKKDFGLSNTDPKLIKLFVNLLRGVLNIGDDRLRCGIRIYEDIDKNKSLEFWSHLTGIPKINFTGIQVLEGKKIGKLEFGMCRIRVLKGEKELKKLKGLYNAIGDLYAPIA